MRTRPAIARSLSVRERPSTKATHSATERDDTSATFFPPTRTDRASFVSLAPLQSVQGRIFTNLSISSCTEAEVVSRSLLASHGSTPSKG